VVFDKEEIVKLVRKFQSTQKSLNLNYQHQKDSQVKQSVVQEIWINDKTDKSEKFGFDLPVGSAFVMSHIGDKEFWEKEVKTGNVKGYSIEGFLNMELKNIKKMNQEKFVTATSKEGVVIQSDAESFTVNTEVYTMENEEKKPVVDGTYTFDNGMSFKVVDSKITEIEEVEPEATEEEMAAIKKMFKSVFASYDAKIAELEVKLSNITVPAKEEEKKEEEVKENKVSTIRTVLSKLKETNNK
jgi:hypothetical protein